MTKRAAKFSIFDQNYRCSYHNHKSNDYHCLLQCGVNCNSTETISTEMWKQLETQTKDWKGLDKFGNIFESTDWEKATEGLLI